MTNFVINKIVKLLMNYVYSEKVSVRNYEADIDGKLKIPMIFNYFQEIAGNHAEKLGWGYEEMKKNGTFWVLSRLQIEIKNLPKWREEIEVLTLPRGIKKLYAVRDYSLRSTSGEELVRGSSGWLILDSKTFRLKNPETFMADTPWKDKPEDMALSTEKIVPFGEKIFEYTRKVTPNDLDVNRHTNNARYAEWLIECYSQEFLSTRNIRRINFTFLNQTKYKDEIICSVFSDKDSSVQYLEAVNSQTGQKVVQAEFEWD